MSGKPGRALRHRSSVSNLPCGPHDAGAQNERWASHLRVHELRHDVERHHRIPQEVSGTARSGLSGDHRCTTDRMKPMSLARRVSAGTLAVVLALFPLALEQCRVACFTGGGPPTETASSSHSCHDVTPADLNHAQLNSNAD